METIGRDGTSSRVDVGALVRLFEEHPAEFERLLEAASKTLIDKHGRTVAVTDKVVTPQGENGMVVRIDKNSKRVLIRLDDSGKTRMLMAHRVVVKRGRPRKDESAMA